MNGTVRNLFIFTFVTITCGWFAVWVNTQIPSPTPQQSLGILIWILAPMVTGLLLRGFGGDGWVDSGFKLNLRGNGFWYALAVLIYPLAIALTVLMGSAAGVLSIHRSFPELLPVIGFGLAAALIKNIGEEFAWRGYLTPRFKALGLSNFNNHILTALIWGAWHIPYWLYFLGSGLIKQYTSLSMTWFIVLGFIGLFPTSLVFGELRLKTGSVWSPYIAHNITNAISAQLIIEGFIELTPGAEFIYSPNMDGILMMVIFWGIGLWMMRREKQSFK